MINDKLTGEVIGAAMKVHRVLEPGLLESAHETTLAYELVKIGHQVDRQKELSIVYEDVKLNCGYRIDLLVNDTLVLKLKCVESLLPIHQAQIISYLKLSGCEVSLLINFHVVQLKQGIKRFVRSADHHDSPPRNSATSAVHKGNSQC